MLDEYKIPDLFWCEAVNTACHAINRLYLHKKLKKTSYELLTGNKPKVSYFRVFGCKCFILNKKPKTSKFAPKVDEGVHLGYGSNEQAYRVFNKTFGRVEIAVDVTFDESNGAQVEQVDSSVVGKEDLPCEAIKQLTIGDIRPQGGSTIEVEVPQVAAAPISADVSDAEQQQTPATTPARGSTMPDCDSVMPTQSAVADLTPTRGQNLQPIFEQEEDEQEAIDHPRLRQRSSQAFPINLERKMSEL